MRTGRARIGYQDQVTREEAEKKQTRKMKMKTETERRKGDTYRWDFYFSRMGWLTDCLSSPVQYVLGSIIHAIKTLNFFSYLCEMSAAWHFTLVAGVVRLYSTLYKYRCTCIYTHIHIHKQVHTQIQLKRGIPYLQSLFTPIYHIESPL